MKSLICLLLCACFGCSRERDLAGLVIVPGFGISNVVEIGMTPEQVAIRNKDFCIEDLRLGYAMSIPSLGVSWEQKSKSESVASIYFNVRVCLSHGVERCFRGNVAGGLSFSAGCEPVVDDVIKVFGMPLHNHRSASMTGADAEILRNWAREDESYSFQNTSAMSEMLNYPSQGILFNFTSNKLDTVLIYHKRPRNTKGQPSE